MQQGEVMALAKEEYNKVHLVDDEVSSDIKAVAWSAWKRAFDVAWRMSREDLSKMVMLDGDIFEVCKSKYANETSVMKPIYMTHYLNGAKMQRDYWQTLVIKSDNNGKK